MKADLQALLSALQPRRNPGVMAFVAVPAGAADTTIAALEPIATFREGEGVTLIVEESRARAAGLVVLLHAAWLTLDVPSGLDAVGLTAAVAGALAGAGIACNVVAAAHHDHLFVPIARADDALAVLRALQARAVNG
ncbi:MAG TPA: ACT domain-containing protein [Burkholderiaceae bacterium]